MADDPPLPTFAGRLQVADFLYRGEEERKKPKEKPALERSPVKRKAETAEPDRSAPRPTASPVKGSGSSKRPRKGAGYAPPATYAHLPELPDALAPHLLVLFVGLNPGLETAQSGHAYAHPSNLFWKLLAATGVTPVACRADEDRSLPQRFRLGLTNIVARPSRSGAELRARELDDGVGALAAKVRRWRPEAVCLVGKGIWDSVVRVRHGRRHDQKQKFHYGWQSADENLGRLGADGLPADAAVADADTAEGVSADPAWPGARVFVASSTSGLAASLRPAEKEAIWQELGDWVRDRRQACEAETGETWT